MQDPTLPHIVAKTISQAENLLRASGCAFKIINPIGAETLHDPEDKFNPKRKSPRKRVSGVPYGALSTYFKPFFENVQVGDVVLVPINGFPVDSLRSSVCARLSMDWGNGSYTCAVNKATDTLEVLRLG